MGHAGDGRVPAAGPATGSAAAHACMVLPGFPLDRPLLVMVYVMWEVSLGLPKLPRAEYVNPPGGHVGGLRRATATYKLFNSQRTNVYGHGLALTWPLAHAIHMPQEGFMSRLDDF